MHNSSDFEEVETGFLLAWAIAAWAGIDPLQGHRIRVESTLDSRISLAQYLIRCRQKHWALGQ